MTTIENQELRQLLMQGESDRVEFKESLTGSAPDRIREAICAFANDLPDHRRPGIIFVGVRNDGSAAGLPITDELLRQLADMKTDGNIVPPPSLVVAKLPTPQGDIAAVIVPPSDSPPVRCRGRIQIRTGPRRGMATALVGRRAERYPARQDCLTPAPPRRTVTPYLAGFSRPGAFCYVAPPTRP